MKKLKQFNVKKNLKKDVMVNQSKCITHNLWDELEIHIQ